MQLFLLLEQLMAEKRFNFLHFYGYELPKKCLIATRMRGMGQRIENSCSCSEHYLNLIAVPAGALFIYHGSSLLHITCI
jgi:hypothetical protein